MVINVLYNNLLIDTFIRDIFNCNLAIKMLLCFDITITKLERSKDQKSSKSEYKGIKNAQ